MGDALDFSAVNVLAEFERNGIDIEWSGQDEIKVKCPFHEDDRPSCGVNIVKRVFKCGVPGCDGNKGGDIVKLLARFLQTTRATVVADLATRYDLETDKTIDIQLVEGYHRRIWQAGPLLQELYKRGLTDQDIREFRLGEHDGRVQIPVPNRNDLIVNIRKYLPGAPGNQKFRNVKGHGENRWFPIKQLQFDKLLITGGELKSIVAIRQLNAHGIGALNPTCGEDNLTLSMLEDLKGKTVWVCLDIDEPGIAAALAKCQQICRVAAWCSEPVLLPLDSDKYPKGDINDFVAIGGQLLPVLQTAQQFKYEPAAAVVEDTSEPLSIDLSQAIHANNTGKRIEFRAVVSAMDTQPYPIPRDIRVDCPQGQEYCGQCPVFMDSRNAFTLQAESPELLELVQVTNSYKNDVIKRALQIPNNCRLCKFHPTSHYNVEDVRLSPRLEIANRTNDQVVQPAFSIGDGVELNEAYVLTGKMFPHPKTQQSTLLISKYRPAQDALSTYKSEDCEELGIFWPDSWDADACARKLTHIYDDFAANVTHVFQRESIHLACDLAYHSPLYMKFDGRTIKGWSEVLIVGDSSQGKSEIACGSEEPAGLMMFYGLGEKVDCRNASVAGLLGGCQQMGSRWFVSWGTIPAHDKRLVILDELKGANEEIVAGLTDMRSSGIAQITKIKQWKTHARTRKIMLSNPRSQLKLSQYNFGVEAIKELIGGLESIRRFDYTLLVSSSEIDVDVLNALRVYRPFVPHVHTADLCRRLVLWAWTRTSDQIYFTPEATDVVLQNAAELCKTFTDAIPLVDTGSMRYKLARLSAAVAARLFSCSEDFQTLVVYPCHVEYIARVLKENYSSQVFGYLDFTRAIEVTQTLLDPDHIKDTIARTPYPNDLCKHLLAKNHIDLQDLCDWCGWEKTPATELLSVFVRKHALVRDGNRYRKTSKFIHMLKELLESGKLKDMPAHLKNPDTREY